MELIYVPSNFSRYIEGVTPTNKYLPLIHSTDTMCFRDICREGKLKTNFCSIFKQNLLYFFYGRPAYKVSTKIENADNIPYAPVTFIYNCTSIKVEQIERIYPFDSGAFKSGLYDKTLYKGTEIDNFRLKNSIDMPRRIINYIFQNNKNYFLGNATKEQKWELENLEISSYIHMVSSMGQIEFDDRKYSIEIQINKELHLEGNIIAVILPLAIMSDKLFDKIENEWKAKALNYPSVNGGNFSEYNGSIRSIVYNLLETGGYFDN